MIPRIDLIPKEIPFKLALGPSSQESVELIKSVMQNLAMWKAQAVLHTVLHQYKVIYAAQVLTSLGRTVYHV